MHSTNDHSGLEAELAAQEPFLRRLAGALVRNEHDAEDAVQEALVAAWRSPDLPRSAPGLRSWLATVLRRTVTSGMRRRGRRGEVPLELEAAECAAGGGEAQDVITERLERQVLLQRATLALPGHYREAVVMRFQDDMGPAEIARALDVPVNTVRTRLQRGLGLLRDELDRQGRAAGESDPRQAWIAALTPLAMPRTEGAAAMGVPPVAATGLTGIAGFLIMKKTLVAALVVLAAIATYVLSPGPGARPDREVAEVPARQVVDPEGATSEVDIGDVGPIAEVTKRAPVSAVKAPDGTPVPGGLLEATAPTIEGTVRLTSGHPVGGAKIQVRVGTEPGDAILAEGVADGEGNFSVELGAGWPTDPVVLIADHHPFWSLDVAPRGSVVEDVRPGGPPLDLRIDGILARITLPLDSDARGEGKRMGIVVRKEDASRPGWAGGYHRFGVSEFEGGRALFPVLLPRSHRLVLRASSISGREDPRIGAVVIEAGLPVGVHDFVLGKVVLEMASLKVSLRLAAGTEAREAIVKVKVTSEIRGQGSQTFDVAASAGASTIERVAARDSIISASVETPAGMPMVIASIAEPRVALEPGGVGEVTIDLESGGNVEVHYAAGEDPSWMAGATPFVLCEPLDGGAPLVPFLVGVEPEGPPDVSAEVVPGKPYSFDQALAPGTYAMTFDGGAVGSLKRTVEVFAGQVTRVELRR